MLIDTGIAGTAGAKRTRTRDPPELRRNPERHEIVLIDSEGKAHQIDGDEGLELQDGMEFRVRQNDAS